MTHSTALGVDYGSRRVGVAVSDELGARPLEVIDRKRVDPILRIKALVELYEIRRVFVGLPFRLDGRAGPEVERARSFVAELSSVLAGIPVDTIDEALTTFEANQRMIDAGIPPEERKSKVDAWAAAVMLEEALSKPDSRARDT
ncbi:MAG: Holliday junction resolvase RuvX [Deltaproteobacteria bacterium]|nr:Holliday junction resolvase RuvX [Deltaproteobacteria bacterium]